jgi:hypothetical protein
MPGLNSDGFFALATILRPKPYLRATNHGAWRL